MILFTRQLGEHPLPAMTCGARDAPQHCLDLSSPAHPGVRDTLRVRTDARSIFWRGSDWWLYAATPVGIDCFPALTELLALGQSQGLDAVLDRLEALRPVAHVAGCQRRGSLHFGRSLDGFASLSFGHDHRQLVIGDSRIDVARQLGEVRLSQADEQHWCRDFLLEPEGSFYQDVKRCFAGVRYHVPAARLEPDRRRLMAPESQAQADADPVAILTDGLRDIFSTYGNRKLALRLSGGADSRVLLVGLMDAVRQGILRRDQVLCTSVLFPGFDCDESPAIRHIVELSGFEWVGIEATVENVQDAYQHCLSLPTPPFPTSFMGVLCAQVAQQRGAELLLTGHGGDEIFQFEPTDLLACSLPGRLSRLDLIRQMRRTHGWASEARALLIAVLGLRGQRTLIRTLRQHHLPFESRHAHRLGRRLILARHCGYENAGIAAHAQGLYLDVPFFRAPFLAQLDPTAGIRNRHVPDKASAHQYLRAHAPDIAAVTCRKVPFDAAVHALFPTQPTSERDAVDTKKTRAYHARKGYADWRIHTNQAGKDSS